MSWDIKVWHEDAGNRTRLVIEAGPEVPEGVIAALAGSYWEEEILYPEGWEGEQEYDDFEESRGPGGLHG